MEEFLHSSCLLRQEWNTQHCYSGRFTGSSACYWLAASTEGLISSQSCCREGQDFASMLDHRFLGKSLRCHSCSPRHGNKDLVYEMNLAVWLYVAVQQSWYHLPESTGAMEYGTETFWCLCRICSNFSKSTEPVLLSPVGYRRIIHGLSKSQEDQFTRVHHMETQ